MDHRLLCHLCWISQRGAARATKAMPICTDANEPTTWKPVCEDCYEEHRIEADNEDPLPAFDIAPQVVISLEYDDSGGTYDPSEEGGFRVVSFGRRHTNYGDPYDYDLDTMDEDDADELRTRLDSGTAWWLRYYEHGALEWALSGEGSPGSDCPFDSVSRAGILFWDGKPEDLAATAEKRAEQARKFLSIYTAWCNGYIFGYSVEINGEPAGSCWGFIVGDDEDAKWLVEEALSAVDVPYDEVTWKGDAAHHAEHYRPEEARHLDARREAT